MKAKRPEADSLTSKKAGTCCEHFRQSGWAKQNRVSYNLF